MLSHAWRSLGLSSLSVKRNKYGSNGTKECRRTADLHVLAETYLLEELSNCL